MGLFGADLPQGFRYVDDFITPDEEAALARRIGNVEFSAFEMRGVVARRRVVHLLALRRLLLAAPLRIRLRRLRLFRPAVEV